MRSLIWRMGCVAITLAALVSYPRASFGIDCGYGGAVDPPLTDTWIPDGFCEAGKLKALNPNAKSRTVVQSKGTMYLTTFNPLEIIPPFSLRVRLLPLRFPPSFLAGSFIVDNSVVATVGGSASTGDITIQTEGDIINNNSIAFSLIAPFSDIRLRAKTRVLLQGQNLGSPLDFPSSQLQGDDVKLSANLGDIVINNASITAYTGGMDITAPRGNITVHNTVLFSIQDRVNTVGFCRFHVKTEDHVVIGHVFGVFFPNDPGAGTADPTNILVCIPRIKH